MNNSILNMLQSLKPFTCPACNYTYSTKEQARFHNASRYPRILNCGHTSCENCLQTAEKNFKAFACTVCKETYNLEDNDFSTTFPPDIHALGILCANLKNSLPSLKVKMFPSSNLKKSLSPYSNKRSDSFLFCGKCNNNQALWQCDECQLNFCSICFKEIHEDRSRKRHEGKKIFTEMYNTVVQQGCSKHENKSVEFYCEVDNVLTCSYCMLVGDHVGHDVKTLEEKNKSCAEDLKAALKTLPNIQKQLKYADHQLCEIIPKEKVDIADIVKDIHDYFHKLHTALQIRENELISDITEISQRSVTALEEMRLKVNNYERELASMKKDSESVIESPCLAVSAPAILRKLEEYQSLPCYLVPLPNQQQLKLNIELPQDVDKTIKEIGEVHFEFKPRFALLPSDDLPENFCMDVPESFSAKFQSSLELESCSVSSVNETFSEDSLSITSPNAYHSTMQASFKCRDFIRKQPEKVTVSYIKNPSTFFVQRFCDARKLKSLSQSINKWCKSSDSKKMKALSVQIGDLYLVRYEADNRWYRGRVKSIILPDDSFGEDQYIGIKSLERTMDGKLVTKDKELKAEVFYIDYGNTETTSLSNIKNIQASFLNLPGMCKECSLGEIEPINGVEWSQEAIQTFTSFVYNKPVVMQILEERNNVYYVDLSQAADSDISNDVPVSVRDALVFLEYAVFSSATQPNSRRKKVESKYMPPEPLRMNASIWAIVSHVEDPALFYIQQMSTASYLATLIFEMNETYNSDENTLLHSVYAPRVDMICAAQYSLDKQWYRAKVIGLPGGAMVKVQYVDFGNQEVVHHTKLRKLYDKFTKLNIQALPCKLAHVTYNQAKGWSQEAKEWLTEQVSRKQLTLTSLGMIPGENKAQVVLYYTVENCEICVNALMVEQGLAESTGERSTVVRQEKPKQVIPKETPLYPAYLTQANSMRIPSPVPRPAEAPPETTTETTSESVEKSPLKSSLSKNKYPSIVPSSNLDEKKHIEVRLSHIESPGSFYVQLTGDNEKQLDSLMKSLQEAYDNLQGDLVNCTVGKAYAAYDKIKKKWCRVKVLSKRPNENIEVQYVDYGNTEIIESKYVRKLLEKFISIESFSMHCHFEGICPAGGSSEWSRSSCDVFRQLVDSNDTLFLHIKGEVTNDSLPSDLLIELLIRGGALEPTKIEYMSVSEEIVKKGFALPIRRKRNSTPKTESQPEPVICNDSKSCEEEIPKPVVAAHPIEPSQNDLISEKIEEPPPKPKFQWKPAVLPTESSFMGVVTNIGEDGSIHLNVMHNGANQADTIRKVLQFKFNKLQHRVLSVAPPIGEACIAKFTLDQSWYRAEIVSVYPGKVKVHFVDYGNNEIVPLSFIRMDLLMMDFPRQCLECVLYGIDSNINWDSDLLTFLHNQLVETEVSVEIKGPPDEQHRLQCQIKTASGIDVAVLLTEMGCEMPVSTKDYTFTSAALLREGDIVPVCVTQVPSENVVFLQILEIPDPKDDYEISHNQTIKNFLELISELREKADSFPVLQDPMPGMPGCAKYSYDDNWYRCEVTDLTQDGIVVLYVDYGNSEMIAPENLRELEPHFIDFPLQLHCCVLDGMMPVGENWDPLVKEIIVQSIKSTDRELYAKVVVSGENPQVDLLTKNADGDFSLAYAKLGEMNLVKFTKPLLC